MTTTRATPRSRTASSTLRVPSTLLSTTSAGARTSRGSRSARRGGVRRRTPGPRPRRRSSRAGRPRRPRSRRASRDRHGRARRVRRARCSARRLEPVAPLASTSVSQSVAADEATGAGDEHTCHSSHHALIGRLAGVIEHSGMGSRFVTPWSDARVILVGDLDSAHTRRWAGALVDAHLDVVRGWLW